VDKSDVAWNNEATVVGLQGQARGLSSREHNEMGMMQKGWKATREYKHIFFHSVVSIERKLSVRQIR